MYFEELMRVSIKKHDVLQGMAAVALGMLTISEAVMLIITTKEGTLVGLVNCLLNCLSKDDKPCLQGMVAIVWVHLAS